MDIRNMKLGLTIDSSGVMKVKLYCRVLRSE